MPSWRLKVFTHFIEYFKRLPFYLHFTIYLIILHQQGSKSVTPFIFHIKSSIDSFSFISYSCIWFSPLSYKTLLEYLSPISFLLFCLNPFSHTSVKFLFSGSPVPSMLFNITLTTHFLSYKIHQQCFIPSFLAHFLWAMILWGWDLEIQIPPWYSTWMTNRFLKLAPMTKHIFMEIDITILNLYAYVPVFK